MKKKLKIYQQIVDEKVIAVIRTNTYEDAKASIEAAVEGGIFIIEITFTTPEALRLIRETAEQFGDQVAVGAGTVLTPQQAALAISAGASFLVSPHVDPDIIKAGNVEQVMVIPGAVSIKDIVEALTYDCSVIKLFPANLSGLDAIKTLKGPLPQVEFIPTGGVNLENIEDWMAAGAIAVGIGGDLTKEAIHTRDFSKVTSYAEKVVNKIKSR
ncbi:hypothetical protein AM500_04975 [Bacillus sp. FJAT-18017]|uniref:bifunctional 4-hydroxy-2-oxoglutarate aldolase/2-dehydro-3-deoxy-phosphogluconate aldolase n=1 Tax=Bacillus sp. FJAT-18017 TaxID=1705566 RepID=UPI0006B068FA|nr:bifunctional 4-hydroxy-2-oxoglutarate aldolase/2-dehydro-3-deoxy-phosphogluconate aldolase [Bacillus sp. FJAT-18017]ALC89209.1 hypothetical protein AM500_04975 [Bacillus sp. FJAT-18017]